HEADDQCVVVEGVRRIAFVSGQTSISNDGQVRHAGDMLAQTQLTLDNVETVLKAAGMDFSNIVHMNTCTTDVDRFRAEAAGPMAARLAMFDVRPPGVLSQVVRLGLPELLIEIEVTAAA
ncbi:MAG: RidA family protein, partial [Pseudomonadota bacterium]|nr:RidA family protein [Pseudomonadota bacterium]